MYKDTVQHKAEVRKKFKTMINDKDKKINDKDKKVDLVESVFTAHSVCHGICYP